MHGRVGPQSSSDASACGGEFRSGCRATRWPMQTKCDSKRPRVLGGSCSIGGPHLHAQVLRKDEIGVVLLTVPFGDERATATSSRRANGGAGGFGHGFRAARR